MTFVTDVTEVNMFFVVFYLQKNFFTKRNISPKNFLKFFYEVIQTTFAHLIFSAFSEPISNIKTSKNPRI